MKHPLEKMWSKITLMEVRKCDIYRWMLDGRSPVPEPMTWPEYLDQRWTDYENTHRIVTRGLPKFVRERPTLDYSFNGWLRMGWGQ